MNNNQPPQPNNPNNRLIQAPTLTGLTRGTPKRDTESNHTQTNTENSLQSSNNSITNPDKPISPTAPNILMKCKNQIVLLRKSNKEETNIEPNETDLLEQENELLERERKLIEQEFILTQEREKIVIARKNLQQQRMMSNKTTTNNDAQLETMRMKKNKFLAQRQNDENSLSHRQNDENIFTIPPHYQTHETTERVICNWILQGGTLCKSFAIKGLMRCEKHSMHEGHDPKLATKCVTCRNYSVRDPKCCICAKRNEIKCQKAIAERLELRNEIGRCDYVTNGNRCPNKCSVDSIYCGHHVKKGARKEEIEDGLAQIPPVYYCKNHLDYGCGGIVEIENRLCLECYEKKSALSRAYHEKKKNKKNNDKPDDNNASDKK